MLNAFPGIKERRRIFKLLLHLSVFGSRKNRRNGEVQAILTASPQGKGHSPWQIKPTRAFYLTAHPGFNALPHLEIGFCASCKLPLHYQANKKNEATGATL